ncbi:MAG: glycosyltransferase family 39 protein [Gammaproteobacteria bacterium]|nr:glycosyltransferase family 39 protein [Gammaproteobacteria bacterium]
MLLARLNERQAFWGLILISLVIKLVIAFWVPVTGDEAYFVLWGRYPDFGYYDHPPMVGWWLTGLLHVSDAIGWLRLPTIITTTLIGLAIYYYVRKRGEMLAVLAAGLYWMAPVNLFVPLITTDTPLIFWSFVSAWCFYRAQRRDQGGWYWLTGICLGLAFISKFFAGLLGIAYLLYIVLFVRRGWRPYRGLLWLILGVVPFIGLNLLWNYQHCWDNYLFNLQNRTADFAFSLITFGKYLLLLLVIMTPPVLYYLWRSPSQLIKTIKQDGLGLFLVLFLVPILLFMVIAMGKSVGGHWILSFYPFLFVALAVFLSYGQLRVCFHFMWGFSLVFLVVFIIILSTIPASFRGHPGIYQDLVSSMHTKALLNVVEPYRHNFPLANPSYSAAAVLAFADKKPVLVIGPGSYHGRQDDMLTDFRQFDGKPMAILDKDADIENYAKYFRSFEHIIIPFEGTQFHLGLGTGFNYPLYRDTVLAEVRRNYYRIPSWLPDKECYMDQRYGPLPAVVDTLAK